MNRLAWIRRAEGWVQEELGAQDRLKSVLDDHMADLISGKPEAVIESAGVLAERTAEAARRAKRLRVLLLELVPVLGEAPDRLATAASCLGEQAKGLAELADRLRDKAAANSALTRRVMWLAGKQTELVRDLLGAACGLEPGTDLDEARGAMVDGMA